MNKIALNLLNDLRKWLMVGFFSFIIFFICCYISKNNLYEIASRPIQQYYMLKHINPVNIFIFTGIWELFFTDIKLCIYTSFLLSMPIFLFCIYKFLSPSLYKREKKIVISAFLMAIILSLLAIIVAYHFIFPRAIDFFLSQTNNIAKPMLNISEYITAFFGLILAFCIVFQLPIILVVLTKLNVISIKQLTKHRKTIIVVIFIISAIITPPDISSQILCAVLLVAIYELTLFFINKTTKPLKEKIDNKTKKGKNVRNDKSKTKIKNKS